MNEERYREVKSVMFAIALFTASVLIFHNVVLKSPEPAQAQSIGNMFLWSDSVLTTTAEIDSLFDKNWDQVLIKSDSVVLWLKIGAPDTNNWDNRDYYKLENGESIVIGPSTKLTRLAWKTDTGTGNIFFAGIKRIKQHGS